MSTRYRSLDFDMDSLFYPTFIISSFFIGQYLHSVWLRFDAEAIRRGGSCNCQRKEKKKKKKTEQVKRWVAGSDGGGGSKWRGEFRSNSSGS